MNSKINFARIPGDSNDGYRRLSAVGILLLASVVLVTSSRANILSWSGGGGANAYWNNTANWGFAGVPGNGDTVIFPASQPNLVNTNNIAGLVLNQIHFAGAGGGYDIRGNAITLTNGISATNTVGANAIENNITLSTAANVLIIVSNGVSLTLDGTLSGSGVGVNKAGLGTLLYQTSGINSYTGSTLVSAGTLEFNVGGVNAVSGPLIIGDGTGNGSPTVLDLQGYEMGSLPSVTINTNGTLNLNNFNEPLFSTNLIMNSGMILTGTGGQLSLLPNSTITVNNIGFSYSFIVGNLIGPFNGNLSIGSGSLTIQGNGGLGVEAAVSGAANIVQNGSVTVEWYGPSTDAGNYTANDFSVVFLADSHALGNVTNQMTLNGSTYIEVADSINLTNQSLTLNSGYLGLTIAVYGNTTNSWTANFILNDPTVVDVGANGVFNMIGPISGSGSLTENDAGYLQFSGSSANTYSGGTTVSAGTLLLSKPFAVTAVPGALTLGANTTVRLLNSFQIDSFTTPITMSDGSFFDLNGLTDAVGPLNLMGATIAGNGFLYFGSNITVNASTVAPSKISGFGSLYNLITVTNAGHNFSPDLVISANLSSGGTTNGLIKAGLGEVALTGNNSFTGPVTVNGGNLWAETSTALGNTNTPATVNYGGSLFLDGNGLDFGLKPLTLSGSGYAFGALSCQGSSSWEGDVTLTNFGNVTIYEFTNSSLTLAGSINGWGGFIKDGPGTNILAGATVNPYQGATFVNDGILNLMKTAGAWAIGYGALTVGDGIGSPASAVVRSFGNNEILNVPLVVNSDGLLDLNGNNDFLSFYVTLNNGNIQNTSAGTLSLYTGTVITANPGVSYISGNLNVETNSFWTNNGTLNMNASVVGNADIYKSGSGPVILTASNSFTGLMVVRQGWLYAQNNYALGTTTAGTIVSNGASLVLQGNVAITNESLTLNGAGEGSTWGALDVEYGTNIWAGPITVNSNSTLDAWNPGSTLHINGQISGPGGLELFGSSSGGGTHYFEGSSTNSYAGTTTVDATSTLRLNDSTTYGAIPTNIVVSGTLRLALNEQISPWSDVQVNAGGLFDFGSFYQDLNTLHGTGNITFGSGGYLNIGVNNGSSEFDGVMSGTGFPGGYTVAKTGAGKFTMTGNNTYLNRSDVYVGTLVINGLQPQSPVLVSASGMLRGSGTVGTITANGTVYPGNSPGILTSSNVTFSSSGIYRVEIAGPNPGTGYDQLNVTGTVTIVSAALQLHMTSIGATNSQLTIINNAPADVLTGTFSGLPEGATVVADNGAHFKITYHGGTGNNVVLTQTGLPTRPTLNGITKVGGGGMQLNGTGFTNLAYSVQGNTNLATANWVYVGTATSDGSGQLQFTDPYATNYPVRFYRFTWP